MIKKLRKHFETIYGEEIVQNLLEDSTTLRIKPFSLISKFIQNYNRFNKQKNGTFKFQGCTYCMNDKWCLDCLKEKKAHQCLKTGLVVQNQDFPFWKGEITNKELVVIGLEIGPQVTTDIHIAYLDDQGNLDKKYMKDKIGLLFENFEEKVYITDLSKCFSTKNEISRYKCLKERFFDELKIFEEINPTFNLVIQGKNEILNRIIEIDEKLTKKFPHVPKNKTKEYFYLKFGKIKKKICRNPHLAVLLPHTSDFNKIQWNYIMYNQEKVIEEIKLYLNSERI